MAKKNHNTSEMSNEAEGAEAEKAAVPPPLPEGFEPVGSSGPQKWVVKGENVIVRGNLLRRFEKPKSKRSKGGAAYEIKLTEGEVEIVLSGESDIAKAGDIVCVDETKALEDLKVKAEMVSRGAAVDVYIRYLEEVDIDGGNTFWRSQCGAKVISPPTMAAPPQGQGSAPGPDGSQIRY